MNWSPEQNAIFEWLHTYAPLAKNLIVRARAGTGKTTTIKEALTRAPEQTILYAVFNKRNQKEAESSISDTRVQVKTLHSLGYGFIRRHWGNARPDMEGDIEFDRARYASNRNYKPTLAAIVKTASFAKNLFIAPDQADILKIIDDRDLSIAGAGEDSVSDNQLALWVLQSLERSKVQDKAGRISFDDMVWLPVALGIVRPSFDLVAIDEAQDMNMPQLLMACGAVKPNGRTVVVGDDRQAIYGFRGAATGGMGKMQIKLRAKVLPLTVTRRCPKSVVSLAREIVSDFVAHDEAPDGVVSNISSNQLIETVLVGDAILSRLNAPLMPCALQLLRKHIPARIEGRDIGNQLMGMVRSMKANDVPDFVKKVTEWQAKQVDRLMNAKNPEKKIELVNDTAETLIALSEGCNTVSDIDYRINSLFQDTDETSKPAVVLSTVHKAKGLEWGRVFILESSFVARPGAPTGEESNIRYVAITRTKSELYLVGSTKTTEMPSDAPSVKPDAKADVIEVNLSRSAGWSYLPAGLVYHDVGNVIEHGRAEYVCTRVSESRAIFVCLSRPEREIHNGKTDEVVRILSSPHKLSISAAIEPSAILRKLSADEMNDFLTGGKRPDSQGKTKQDATESETTMTKKTTGEKKERQSLAGRSGFIAKQKESGKNKQDAWEATKKKWHVTTMTDIVKIYDGADKAKALIAKNQSTPDKTTTKSTKTATKALTRKTSTKKPPVPTRTKPATPTPIVVVATAGQVADALANTPPATDTHRG